MRKWLLKKSPGAKAGDKEKQLQGGETLRHQFTRKARGRAGSPDELLRLNIMHSAQQAVRSPVEGVRVYP